jgi:2-dehydropantoate 2-reductase
MRICVFGAGALGSAIGGLLVNHHDVVLVGRRPHVRAIRSNGLRLLGDKRGCLRVAAVESLAGVSPADLVVLTTKAYDTQEAVAAMRLWADERTSVLTLQNGLGNLEILRKWKGPRAFGGVTTMGATLLGPGRVRVAGLGETVIGSDVDPSGARAIAAAFSVSGIRASTRPDILTEIWKKAAVSACINPTTAVLGVANGRLLESQVIRRLLLGICEECALVASCEGVDLRARGLWSRAMKVARNTARNRSSMLQDVERGKRTEICQISGAFASLGDEHGISTPLNDVLAAMVGTLENVPRAQKG